MKTKKKRAYLTHMCENDVNTVAIKTIRFHDITKLKPFYDVNYDLNFKAVMLIRDPRSMFHSRKNILLNIDKLGPKALPDMLKTLAHECRNYATRSVENGHVLPFRLISLYTVILRLMPIVK